MPFTIVLVTPLIVIMKDQVEHLKKIGVAAAVMGGDVDEAVNSGSCEIVYLSLDSLFFVTYTLKSCFKDVNKFIVHEYFSPSLLSESLT